MKPFVEFKAKGWQLNALAFSFKKIFVPENLTFIVSLKLTGLPC